MTSGGVRYVDVVVVALIFLVWITGRAVAAPNACRDTASCCHIFNFEPGAEIDLAAFGPINGTTAWSAQGISVRTEEPSTLGLLNLTKALGGSSIAGASDLASASEGMALAAFTTFPSVLLRRTQTWHWQLKKQSACIAKVRTSQTLPFSTRQSVTLSTTRTVGTTTTTVQTQNFPWTSPTSASAPNWVEYEFTNSQVDGLKVYFYGLGYGSIDSVEVCYAAPNGRDACGICGGDGTTCVSEGSPCDTGLGGICSAGTVDAEGECIPNNANNIEICNGIDDNCDGLIDDGYFGVVSCGRVNTTCYREYSRCIDGQPNELCVPGQPEPEICDGLDNDCDGVVDNSPLCSASQTPSASPSTSTTSTASASPQPSPSQSSSTSASASTSSSPSPSTSSTPSPSPVSPSPTPSSTPLPRDGSAYIVPLLSCVRQLGSLQTWQAVFGYAYMGSLRDTTVALGRGSNILTSSDWSRSPLEQSQPTFFKAGVALYNAFTITFDANEELQWLLQTNSSNVSTTTRQVAVANRYSPLCQDSGVSSLMNPVQPQLSYCVSQLNAAVCTASFGYFNPNPQDIQLDVGVGRNEFVATNTAGPQVTDRRQPRVFWPGTRHEAVTVTFDCSHTAWSLCWSLSTMGTQTSACVDQSNVCQ